MANEILSDFSDSQHIRMDDWGVIEVGEYSLASAEEFKWIPAGEV